MRDEDGKWKLSVSESPKTETGIRKIIFNERSVEIIKLLHEMNPAGEFLFMNKKRSGFVQILSTND